MENDFLKPILREITLNELTNDNNLTKRTESYLILKNETSKLIVKYKDGKLYFTGDNSYISYELDTENTLHISVIIIDYMTQYFSFKELIYLIYHIFDELTSFSISDIKISPLSIKNEYLNDSKGIPLVYYKNKKTFDDNAESTTMHFFYDDYNSNFTGDFLDMEKFRKNN